jgi:hypothetical protein
MTLFDSEDRPPHSPKLNMLTMSANDPRFDPYIWADQLPKFDGEKEAEQAVREKEKNAKDKRERTKYFKRFGPR